MSEKHDLLKARFILNMKRISGLVNLIFSIDVLKPTGFAQFEGVSADICRFAVVFLHATFESLVRSQTHQPDKKWSFYSGADIDKALHRSGIDPKPFKSLYPPLTQLAKRRKRIVHHADFSNSTETVVKKWDVVDLSSFVIWNLAVVSFYYRLLVVTRVANKLESKIHEQYGNAMTAHGHFAKQMMAFPKTQARTQGDAAHRMADTLESISSMLTLDLDSLLKDDTPENWLAIDDKEQS